MTAATPRKPLTVAIHPNSRGFGWVAFEGPFAPYDWGSVFIRRDKNSESLRRIEAMFARLTPDTLVIESFDKRVPRRGDRIVRLYKSVLALAADRGLEVAIYTRDQIRACFAHLGAKTRHEIAEAVARHIDALRHRLPKNRRAWEGEDWRMALFSAAALVLTHFQFGASDLFGSLS
jgi:hypothetical protein